MCEFHSVKKYAILYLDYGAKEGEKNRAKNFISFAIPGHTRNYATNAMNFQALCIHFKFSTKCQIHIAIESFRIGFQTTLLKCDPSSLS